MEDGDLSKPKSTEAKSTKGKKFYMPSDISQERWDQAFSSSKKPQQVGVAQDEATQPVEPSPEKRVGPATWRHGKTDEPINVVENMGEGPDGRVYVKIEGSQTGIPLDEIIFPENVEEGESGKSSKQDEVQPDQKDDQVADVKKEEVKKEEIVKIDEKPSDNLAPEQAAADTQGPKIEEKQEIEAKPSVEPVKPEAVEPAKPEDKGPAEVVPSDLPEKMSTDEYLSQVQKELDDKLDTTKWGDGSKLKPGEKRSIIRDFYLAKLGTYSVQHEPGFKGSLKRFLSVWSGTEEVKIANSADGSLSKAFKVNWYWQHPSQELVDYLKSEFEKKVRNEKEPKPIPEEPAPEPPSSPDSPQSPQPPGELNASAAKAIPATDQELGKAESSSPTPSVGEKADVGVAALEQDSGQAVGVKMAEVEGIKFATDQANVVPEQAQQSVEQRKQEMPLTENDKRKIRIELARDGADRSRKDLDGKIKSTKDPNELAMLGALREKWKIAGKVDVDTDKNFEKLKTESPEELMKELLRGRMANGNRVYSDEQINSLLADKSEGGFYKKMEPEVFMQAFRKKALEGGLTLEDIIAIEKTPWGKNAVEKIWEEIKAREEEAKKTT
jgi:hypothetical protein